jgi:hypothetical protein
MSDITSELHTVTMFIIVDVQNGISYMVHCNVSDMLCAKFHVLSFNDLLYISITMNAQKSVCIAAILLLHILEKHYCNKVALTLR